MSTAAPSLTLPAGRAEDRRLKMVGLTLIVLGAACMVWLSNQAQWPIAPARFAALALGSVLVVNLLAIGLLVTAAGCGKTHSASAPQRRRSALLLRLTLANVLAPALLYTMITSDPAVDAEFKRQGWDTTLSIVLMVLVVVAWRLWRRSRQYGALDAEQAMRRDPRAPVLYLRSFADDGEALLGAQSPWFRRGANLAAPVNAEQEMADILDAIGPVVAIGKPGEPLPELGAARLYVADDQWQAKVQELMRKARLVVLRVGSTPGLLWEIEQALEHLPRQRIVFALLGGSVVAPAVLARLAPVLGPSFEAALPQAVPTRWTGRLYRDPRRRIGGLVCFAADGSAHATAVRRWPLQWQDIGFMLMARAQAAPLRRAWREVFGRLGLGTGNAARSRGLAVTLALTFGWFGAHWFYLGKRRRGVVYVLMIPLLLAPLFLGFVDAYRFLWVDRAEFDTRFSAPRGADPRVA